jgi:uncharacterized protein (TIGR00251 family)
VIVVVSGGISAARTFSCCHGAVLALGASTARSEHRARQAVVRKMTVIGVVVCRTRVSRLQELEDGTWLAEVKAPPIDGQANEELIGLVARHFGRRRAQVSVKSGASGRRKLVEIDDVD